MVYPEVTTWVDDDKGDVGFVLNKSDDSEALLEVKIRKGEDQ